MIVYDVSNEQTYEKLNHWRNAFSNATQVNGVPFVILGNKSDIASRVAPSRVTKEWVYTGKCDAHILTSALTNQNVTEAFQQISNLGLKF